MSKLYSAGTKERANKLSHDICEALAGSGYFRDDRLVVTPVEPIYDLDGDNPDEPIAYGFQVYFDTGEFGDYIEATFNVYRVF